MKTAALVLCLFSIISVSAQQISLQSSGAADSSGGLAQSNLTAAGASPFHLQASITDRDDPDNPIKVEMYWVSPSESRREIKSNEFTQTLIVNGDSISDEHTDDYVPVVIQTLITAMTDPAALLASRVSTDKAFTEANRSADNKGVVCFGAGQPGKNTLCMKSNTGLREIMDVRGRPIQFTDYQKFFGHIVARQITMSPDFGVSYTARITFLSRLENPDPDLFSIRKATPIDERLRAVEFSDSQLRALLPEQHDIIWPQPLDGKTKGTAAYYVSIDPEGQVRETFVVHSDNERANDSARRQIMRWKLQPPTQDGHPVQAGGVLTFTMDTRAFGPAEPLTDEQARNLATDVAEPIFEPGVAPSGSTYSVRIAVDTDGQVIEMIGGSGPAVLTLPCMNALKKWHFRPINENGQPRPYRAEVQFRVP